MKEDVDLWKNSYIKLYVIWNIIWLGVAWAMFIGGIYLKFGDKIKEMTDEMRQEVIDEQMG